MYTGACALALLSTRFPLDHFRVGLRCSGLSFVGVSLTRAGILGLTSGGCLEIKLFREVDFLVVFWFDHFSTSGFIIKYSEYFYLVVFQY